MCVDAGRSRAAPILSRAMTATSGNGVQVRGRVRLPVVATLIATAVLGGVSCSSSSDPAPSPGGTTSSPRVVPTAVSRDIREAWANAFTVGRPPAQRSRSIVKGNRLLPWLKRQQRSSTWAGTRALVQSIALTDANHATVGYRLVKGDRTIVSAGGAAVQVHGSWLVASSTVCALSIIRHDRAPGC